MDEEKQEKNIPLILEFIKLVNKDKLKIADQSVVNTIKATYAKEKFLEKAIWAGLLLYLFKNFQTLNGYFGPFKTFLYVSYIGAIITPPIKLVSTKFLVSKYYSLSLEYQERVYEFSENYRNHIDNEKISSQRMFGDRQPRNEEHYNKGFESNKSGQSSNLGFYDSHSVDDKQIRIDKEFYENHYSGRQEYSGNDENFGKKPDSKVISDYRLGDQSTDRNGRGEENGRNGRKNEFR